VIIIKCALTSSTDLHKYLFWVYLALRIHSNYA
jgi:hypothetical protein